MLARRTVYLRLETAAHAATAGSTTMRVPTWSLLELLATCSCLSLLPFPSPTGAGQARAGLSPFL